MFCPKCGKINPDNSEICSGCNAPLHDENEKKAPEKKIKWGKIILVAVIVIIVAVVVAVALSGCGNASVPEDRITF